MTTLTSKTAAQFRDDGLRTYKNGMALVVGVANFNVASGSEPYQFFNALGLELESVSNNTTVAADSQMPDTATGADLDRQMGIVGLARKGAGPATGRGTFSTSAGTLVATGAQLLAPNSAIYVVVTGGTYNNGDAIPVQSLSSGLNTNLAGGTALRWVSPPAYASPTMSLDSNGCTGGVDQEDDDTARARLLDRLQNPPSGGNAASVAATAEGADVAIQKAFIFPACNGPGTTHGAVMGYATASASRSRVVGGSAVANATSAIVAAHPEYVELVNTATVDQAANVSMLLRLPAATTAIPAGTGGGFVDANPFPSVAGIDATRVYCRVSAFTSSVSIQVESMVAPVVGQSVCWVDRTTFTLHTAKILTQSTNSAPAGALPGTYNITLDTPFVSSTGVAVAVNDYVFPAAVNTQAYVTALLNYFATLGPYEKTTTAGLLPHAYRLPRYYESWDYTLGAKALRAISNAGNEVLDVGWGYQNGGTTVPALPATILSGPNVFVPSQIGFYSQ